MCASKVFVSGDGVRVCMSPGLIGLGSWIPHTRIVVFRFVLGCEISTCGIVAGWTISVKVHLGTVDTSVLGF